MTPTIRRLHPALKITRTLTGRLATSGFPVLGLPKHSEEGKRFRRLVRAPRGFVIYSIDYSQIELRVAAELSRDEGMIEAFRSGQDIHALTAHRVLGAPANPKQQDESKHRLPAKACYHPDTEVLTKDGWVRIANLRPDEEVIQAFPSQHGKVRLGWTVPLDVFTRNDYRSLVHLQNENIDLRVTPDHRMLEWNSDGEWTITMPEAFGKGGFWVNAGILATGHPKGNTHLLRIAVACQADGSYKGRQIIWGFSKQRKVERLRRLLTEAGLTWAEQTYRPPAGDPTVTRLILRDPAAVRSVRRLLDPDKTLPWRWLLLPLHCRQAVLDEAAFWDSHQCPHGTLYLFSTMARKNADVLQAIGAVSGRKSRLVAGDIATLSMKTRAHTCSGHLTRTRASYKGPVVCLSVPSSFVLVRSHGVTLICGQCNFGYWMGLEAKGLTEQVRKAGRQDWSADCGGCRSYKLPHDPDCDSVRFFKEFDRQFPGAKAYRQDRIAHAHETGMAYGLWGAEWYLPGVWSPHDEIREATERQTFALPIQEGAQRLIKQAMARVAQKDLPWARKQQARVEPILQIHDELLFCVEKSFVKPWHRRVKQSMESVASWVVPIVAEGSAGPSWLEKEKL